MNEGKPDSKPFNAGHHPLHPSFLSLGAGDALAWVTVIHGADAPWLDSCDIPRVKPEDRNEGGWDGGRIPSKAQRKGHPPKAAPKAWHA